MRPGVHYNQTYVPVLDWESISILLSKILRNNWDTMQLNYVLVFPREPVDRDCYMKI